MLKKILEVFISAKTTLLLLIAFAFACAYGTFLENDYGTPEVWASVYDTLWFELLMMLLGLNFIANIRRYNLLRKEKLNVLLFHIGFIIVLLGAFVTRYTGFSGSMEIREGASSNTLFTSESYVTFTLNEEKHTHQFVPSIFNPNHIDGQLGETIGYTVKEFVPNAAQTLVAGTNEYLEIVVATAMDRKTLYLKSGETYTEEGNSLGFNTPTKQSVDIYSRGDSLSIRADSLMEFMIMQQQISSSISPDSLAQLQMQSLYVSQNLRFVVVAHHTKSQLQFATSTDAATKKNLPGKLLVELQSAGTSKLVTLDYFSGEYDQSEVSFGNEKVKVMIGPNTIPLGFSLALKDFVLVRYPGSTSPSEYNSLVEVQDGDTRFDYKIFMNNVLDYKGFRFFQASYHTDEKGTILSVNHDWWGTHITYLGYLILSLCMVLSLFGKKSRFQFLSRQLKVLKEKKAALFMAFMLAFGLAQGQATKVAAVYPEEISEHFGALLVQDMDGRIKPVNTLASELMRKITGKTRFHLKYDSLEIELDPNQFMIAIHSRPWFWGRAPIIAIDAEKGNDILKALEKENTEFLSLQDFFDTEGNYRIEDMVNAAHQTKTSERNEATKEIIKVDERFNIVYHALSTSYLKIFPVPGDVNNKWVAGKDHLEQFPSEDSLFVKKILPMFYASADSAMTNGEWKQAEEIIDYIHVYQQKIGKDVVPSNYRVKAELFYNKAKIFLHLFYSYWIFGLLLLGIAIIKMISGKPLKVLQKGAVGIVVALFALQTANMIIRWYAGGYPPWSNGYEMTLLVAWFTMLFGLLLHRRTDFILPLASLFTGTLLFVAFLDWLNPEITNLVPVLKSYWLKIHVAIIVGSYAPLALSALLGFTALWIMALGKKGAERLSISLKELSHLNEMSLSIGLIMLSIGTFLGGVWANESWGRYWAWDPKETWALISILVYAVILHLRLIPSIKPYNFWLNASSVVGFFSIIMTSYGVNYYLSGLHSYAQGDPVPIPGWVYVMLAIVCISILLAYLKRNALQRG